MLSDWLLRWLVKSFKDSSLYITSTNHSHHFGFWGKESIVNFVDNQPLFGEQLI